MSSVVKPSGAYKMEEAGSPPRTIRKLTKIDPMLVSFVDGEGRDQTRIVFRVPGTESFFVVQEKIQGNFVVTAANNWFNKALAHQIDSNTKAEVESI